MAGLDSVQVGKLKRGELCGRVAAVVCGAALLYFIVCFSVAQALDLAVLRLVALISAPVIMAASAGVSAYCNLKFGAKIDKLIGDYVRDVLVENASLMHPEKTSLCFLISVGERGAEVAVNNFKEKIIFDFSAFGNLSAVRRSQIFGAISAKLSDAFLRMYERGVKLSDVSYRSATSKKSATAYIIEGGAPDKKAYRAYKSR